MTKEFAEGIFARDSFLQLSDNPYFLSTLEKQKEWANGWKLEDWRLRTSATRKEINRQIQTNRILRRDDESY